MEKVASRFLFSNFTYENILEGSTEGKQIFYF
jgi:hypothetical protein